MDITCRSCGHADITEIGPLPPALSFAGTPLDEWLPGGKLYVCRTCHLYFRHPIPSEDKLNSLYAAAHADAWSYESKQRADWRIVREHIDASHQPSRVVDIGCYDGAFLTGLDAQHERLGIEVNETAARAAASRGISIVGKRASDIGTLARKVDYITAFDVVEHLPDPLAFLRSAGSVLSSDGAIFIATGSTDARSWRLMQHRYWYCANPEHLSFVNEAWARYAADAAGLHARVVARYAHDADAGLTQRASQFSRNLLAKLAPGFAAWMRLRGIGDKPADTPEQAAYPPYWASARDHILLEFTLPE